MALKAIITSEVYSSMSSEVQEHYVLDDKTGSYVLGIEDFNGMPQVKALKDEAAQHRIKTRDLSKNLEAYKALGTPEEVQTKLDKYPELEAAAAGKLDETKINSIVESRVNSRLAPIEREKTKLMTQVTELGATLEQYKTKESQRTIGDAVRAAATKLKVTDSAVEDAIMYAERLFAVGEDGSVLTKDNSGVTPGISPEVWLTDMQAKRPHWWGPSQGGGASGSRSGGVGGTNPWTAENWNMTEQARILREDRSKAEQMAKNAGTSIGGTKPAPKK